MGWIHYLVRRLLLAVVTLFGISLVTFAIITLAPGDPGEMRVGDVRDPRQSERMVMEIRKRFHLDDPFHVRYFLWMKDVITGNLGTSIADDQPVGTKIWKALPATLVVQLIGLFLAFALSVPIGIYSAARQDRPFDRVVGALLYALHSVPSYVGAILLILFVSVRWDLLPFRGIVSDDYARLSLPGQLADRAAHMTLYVICIAYGSIAFYSRFVRQNLLEVVRQDYIRTARAKGLPERTVVVRHGFRNTLIPFITLLGLTFPVLISGSVILEVIFTWPGLGRLFYDSIYQRDYPVVMAMTMATACLVLVGTLVADLLYGVVDPRVRYE